MIAFDQPLVFLALPVLALVVLVFELRLGASPGRKASRCLVRILVLSLAVGALAGPYDDHERERPRRLLIAIDTSARLPANAAAETASVAATAASSARASNVAVSQMAWQGDAAAALAQARLALRAEESGGILLITDGRDGLTGLQQAVAALRAEGVVVTAAAVPRAVADAAPAARVAGLDVPETTRGPFVVRAAVEGHDGSGALVVLRVDGEVHATQALDGSGAGELRFDELDLEPGVHEIGVTLQSPTGENLALARRLVTVGTPPRVVSLLADASGSPWRRALGAQGLAVADVAPEALRARLLEPGTLPDLLVADAASLGALTPDAALLLVARVRDGLGLLVEPGTDRAAWAPLAGSALSEVLPLLPQPEPPPPPKPQPPEPPPPEPPPPPIDPPEDDEGPGLKAERRPEEALPITLLLVVDRSPSMQGAKMAMAIRGAQEAARALSDWDRIGIITFADDVRVDVPPRSARGASSIPLWLANVEAGGKGTNLAGALRKAREVFEKERSPILHLILLTDGRQHPPGPIFGPIVKPMRRRGITITAVGIGRGARMDQLRDIVQWAARGLVVSAATPRDIPIIMTRDTREVAAARSEKAQAIEARLRPDKDSRPPEPPKPDQPAPPPRRPDKPTPSDTPPPQPTPASEAGDEGARVLPIRLLRPHEALSGFEDAPWPKVGTPRRSEAVSGAAVLLEREDGRPILAAGRVGLGRVLQWTLAPDDPGALSFAPLGRLYGQIARSVMAPRGAFGYLPTARVTHGPDGALLHVTWPRGTSTGVVEATWHGPEGPRTAGRFTPEDGSARSLPAAPAGTLCRLEMRIVDGPPMPALSYLARPRPAAPPQAGDPAALAAALGSELVDPARFAATLPLAQRTIRRDHWPLLLWLVVGLLPFDVFLHRRRRAS